MRSERSHSGYLLVILMVVSGLINADSVAQGLLLQNIKTDLHLSDTQLGVLTGIAFALFSSLGGVLIARWADRGNRVAIIAISIVLWSMMVVLYAVATSFHQLLLIRVGEAISAAGFAPASVSLIADHVSREGQPRAYARYLLGSPVSLFIGYFAGGWLTQICGWRMALVLMGLPGLLVGPLVWLSLREPRVERRRAKSQGLAHAADTRAGTDARGAAKPGLQDFMRNLVVNAALRHLVAYWVLATFFAYGISQFQPTFLMRSYGLTSRELGTWLAVISGLGGLIGIYLGGEWASRHAANNEPLQLKAAAVVFTANTFSFGFLFFSTHLYMAFGVLALMTVIGNVTTGPLFATLQTLVPARQRATTFALITAMSSLIGVGLGPLASGALSDALRPWLGEESLRYALLALCPGYMWCAWLLWRASKTIARDMKSVQDGSEDADSKAADRLMRAPDSCGSTRYT